MTVERETTYRQVVLAAFSKGDGPVTVVSRMKKVEVRDATPADVIDVHIVEHDLASRPSTIRLRGSVTKHMVLPKGKVRVKRVAGTSPVTVLAHCERFISSNGHPTPQRHDLR